MSTDNICIVRLTEHSCSIGWTDCKYWRSQNLYTSGIEAFLQTAQLRWCGMTHTSRSRRFTNSYFMCPGVRVDNINDTRTAWRIHHGPDPAKISVVDSMKRPSTKKVICKMFGVLLILPIIYQGFCFDCLSTHWTNKKVATKYSCVVRGAWKAFETLSCSLIDAIKLHTVEYGKPFGLLIGVSNYVVGCCCIQSTNKGTEKPIAFASCKLSQSQKNWAKLRKRLML